MLVGLRKYGGDEIPTVAPGEVAGLCKHADAANVGAQREVARALANVAASETNHAALMDEGALALCLDLVVSNSADVQAQATRLLSNLALSEERPIHEQMVDEGALDLLVLLAASWDEGVQQEAAIALTNFAHQPYNRTAVVKSGAMQPLLEQLSSPSAGVAYHAAQALMAMQ